MNVHLGNKHDRALSPDSYMNKENVGRHGGRGAIGAIGAGKYKVDPKYGSSSAKKVSGQDFLKQLQADQDAIERRAAGIVDSKKRGSGSSNGSGDSGASGFKLEVERQVFDFETGRPATGGGAVKDWELWQRYLKPGVSVRVGSNTLLHSPRKAKEFKTVADAKRADDAAQERAKELENGGKGEGPGGRKSLVEKR